MEGGLGGDHGGASAEMRGQPWVLILELITLHKAGSPVQVRPASPQLLGFSCLCFSSHYRHATEVW